MVEVQFIQKVGLMKEFKPDDEIYFIHSTPQGFRIKHGRIDYTEYPTYKVWILDGSFGYTHVSKVNAFETKTELLDSL